MGSSLIKPVADLDLYVWWSTVSDGPVVWGTRKEFKKLYKKRKWMFRFGEDFREQLQRADETGFGSRFRQNNDSVRVGDGDLPLSCLPAYLKIYETDLSMSPDDPKLYWLVDKWDWEDEDD